MKICSYCDTENQDDAVYCTSCGSKNFKIRCQNCGTILDGVSFCPNCGVKAGAAAKKCPNCATEYYSNACPNCGYVAMNRTASQTQPVQPIQPIQPQVVVVPTVMTRETQTAGTPANARNKWVAFFLCLFLGIIGAHKFYEGKTLMGIIYLFTGGLFGIGWIVDCLILLFKPNPYYVN